MSDVLVFGILLVYFVIAVTIGKILFGRWRR